MSLTSKPVVIGCFSNDGSGNEQLAYICFSRDSHFDNTKDTRLIHRAIIQMLELFVRI